MQEETGHPLRYSSYQNWCPVMVRRKGLEPPTYWFVASHSIQLSYRRIPRFHQRLSIIAHEEEKCKHFFREFPHFLFDRMLPILPSRTQAGLSASCSKSGAKFCRIWRAEFFCGCLKKFCAEHIIEVQSKIGSCKEVFRTRAATITRLAG